jgi:hypothetical protein
MICSINFTHVYARVAEESGRTRVYLPSKIVEDQRSQPCGRLINTFRCSDLLRIAVQANISPPGSDLHLVDQREDFNVDVTKRSKNHRLFQRSLEWVDPLNLPETTRIRAWLDYLESFEGLALTALINVLEPELLCRGLAMDCS